MTTLATGGGRYTNMLITPSGPFVIWNRDSPSALMGTRCLDTACRHTQTFELWGAAPSTQSDPRFIDAAISTVTGDLLAVFSTPSPVLLMCTNASLHIHASAPVCTSRTLAEGPQTAYPSLAFRRPNGQPMVAYFEHSWLGGSLVLTSCLDAQCSRLAHTLRAQAPGFDVGKYPSLSIGQDGVPAVSYLQASALDAGRRWSAAMLLRCSDEMCRAWERASAETLRTAPLHPHEGSMRKLLSLMFSSKCISRRGCARVQGLSRRWPMARVVDSEGVQTGSFTRLLHGLGSSASASVLYFSEGSGDLRIATCQRLHACETRTLTQVGIQPYGEFPSYVLSPASGFGVAAFFNQTSNSSGSLRLLVCCDASCARHFLSTLATGACGFGRDASIAFAGARTYISFLDFNQDGRNKKLKVLVLPRVAGSECAAARKVVMGSSGERPAQTLGRADSMVPCPTNLPYGTSFPNDTWSRAVGVGVDICG